MKSTFRCTLRPAIALTLCFVFGVADRLFAADAASDTELKFALILTRHGVRSPLSSQTKLGQYAVEPWPEWEVPPGNLTPHGKKQMTLMGEYYRALFIRDGLLQGRSDEDARQVYFRADNDERTIETARGIGAALLPGVALDIHVRGPEKPDPMFRPAAVPVGHIDRGLGIASVLGRLGGDPAVVQQANRAAYDTLEKILVGESGEVPAGKVGLLQLKPIVARGEGDHTVDVRGPLQTAESIIDVLLLEYADGMPMDKVGWGRTTPERLTQVLELHSLFFELAQGSSYPARVQGSNLASHILASLEQAATGKADPRAFGTPDQKLVVIVGHDTNIVNLGGLLNLTWWLPNTHRNPVLPGGAMIFELRERKRDHQLFVCVSYVCQTLDQMRNLTPLSLENPPTTAPIFIPDASEGSDRFGAPFPKFVALVNRVVDPEFMTVDPD